MQIKEKREINASEKKANVWKLWEIQDVIEGRNTK